MERKNITIVGLGLIGGSMALRLHEKKIAGRIRGVDLDPGHAQQALDLELVDEIVPAAKALEDADVIVLCIPVDQVESELPGLLDRVEKHQVVLDLGSTKGNILDSVAGHPNRGRFVGTHPMWGTEYSGPAAARKDAFENKAVILCDVEKSDADAVEWVESMYRKIGMRVIRMQSDAHDLHAAYVSHVSHVTSFALANTVLKKEKEDQAVFEMASSGFESTVRLAKSHAAMWVPIFLKNRTHLLDVLQEHLHQIERFRLAIEESDAEKLEALIREANQIKRILK
jgi:prephenate dehydrogenase